jgi:hypothetical protein
MDEYLLTDGTRIILSKEQLELISYQIDVKYALKLLDG